ncbi:MAG: hypothetical protein KAJ10_15290, partial [Thermodesulfovibrionia bacterium]|nr:hypothetical protein [Thermodesulfovibrionia bacterium]
GSRIYEDFPDKFQKLSQLTFTPKWRIDYKKISSFRKIVYLQYIIIKLIYHPVRTFGYGWALLTRRFRTKVEMTVFRKIKVTWLAHSNKSP